MKKFITFFFVTITILLLIIAIIPAFLGERMEISVKEKINAPVHVVFDEINNLKKQNSWNALFKKDSAINIVYFSPYLGKDASFKWESKNKNIGNGEIKITQSVVNKMIESQLFFEGQTMPAKMKYSVKEVKPNQTECTWTFLIEKTYYFDRYFSFFLGGSIKNEMENSLQLLNAKMATMKFNPSQKNIKPNDIVKEFYPNQKFLALEVESDLETKVIMKAVKNASKILENYFRSKLKINADQLGTPIIYYENWDETASTTKFWIGYPINTEPETIPENMMLKKIEDGNVLKTRYVGKPYDTKLVYEKLSNYGITNNLELGNAWEVYTKIPSEKDTANVYIYHQIKN